jgi:LysR family carnitine catabolism transcriptional activator
VQSNLNLSQIATFVAVAEAGSFRSAADQLCISPPAVSARIQQLEQTLGVRLFNRTTRSVSLTAEGGRLLGTSTQALSELTRMTSQLKSEAALAIGRVNLATVVSISSTILPGLLHEFAKQHPGLIVDFIDVGSETAKKSVLDGHSDLALTSMTLASRGLVFEPLYREECLPVVHRDHPLATRRSVDLRQVARHTLIGPPKGSDFFHILSSAFAAESIRFEPQRVVIASATIAALVDAGHGIAFLTRPYLLRLNMTNSKMLRLKPHPIWRDNGIVTAENRSLSPAAQAFRAFLVRRLGNPRSFELR